MTGQHTAKRNKRTTSKHDKPATPVQPVRERIPSFDPIELHQLVNEAQSLEKRAWKHYTDTVDEQLRLVMATYKVDPHDPEAYKKALIEVCGDFLGVGQLTYRPPKKKGNAQAWTRQDDNALLFAVTRFKLSGLSEREAIRQIVKRPKDFHRFPYRPKKIRQTGGTSITDRENALWQRWNKIKKEGGIGRASTGDPMARLLSALSPLGLSETADPVERLVEELDFQFGPLGELIGKNQKWKID